MTAERAFESKIVKHCSPTLAGDKPASLFNCVRIGGTAFSRSNDEHVCALMNCRAKIAQGGCSLQVLLQREKGALVFVYRIGQIARMLRDERSRDFLAARGYDVTSPHACIAQLKHRVETHECRKGSCDRCEFPHEIGLFLGYPFDDVVAFIENGGHGESCTGTWKAYSNPDGARATFNRYRESTNRLTELFEMDTPIEELAMIGAPARRSA